MKELLEGKNNWGLSILCDMAVAMGAFARQAA